MRNNRGRLLADAPVSPDLMNIYSEELAGKKSGKILHECIHPILKCLTLTGTDQKTCKKAFLGFFRTPEYCRLSHKWIKNDQGDFNCTSLEECYGYFHVNHSKKMTDASLWGPKRPK